MSVLRKTSKTTSHEQLKTVLQEALSRGHIKRADTKEAADSVIADLENPESELRKTMANLKPLQYV
jgi:phage-related baseplate assembly protein